MHFEISVEWPGSYDSFLGKGNGRKRHTRRGAAKPGSQYRQPQKYWFFTADFTDFTDGLKTKDNLRKPHALLRRSSSVKSPKSVVLISTPASDSISRQG